MLGALVLCEDKTASCAIEQLAIESKQVSLHKVVNKFPSVYELARMLNTFTPDLVFLELSEWSEAAPLVQSVRTFSDEVGIVGFGGQWSWQWGPQFAEAGVAAFLTVPFDLAQFQEAVAKAIRTVRPHLLENLLAFVPAKAGSGATTIGLNLGGCLAAMRKKVLILEADLYSGVLSDLVNAQVRGSIAELLGNAASVQSVEWHNSVTHALGMDLLLTDRNKRTVLPQWSDYHQVLRFARPRYDFLLADLPEVVNEATVELVQRARNVFVVCTTELQSLALARQRCRELQARGVHPGRVRIILNRWHKSDVRPEYVEDLLKRPVAAVIRNDYRSVQKAAVASSLIDERSEVGKSIAAFARTLVGEETAPQKSGLGILDLIGTRRN